MPNYNENIIFSSHPVSGAATEDMREIRRVARQLALLLRGCCPQGRELSSARTNLELVMFWANAGIARQAAYTESYEKARGGTLEEAITAEEERVKAVRAAHPGAKNQTVG